MASRTASCGQAPSELSYRVHCSHPFGEIGVGPGRPDRKLLREAAQGSVCEPAPGIHARELGEGGAWEMVPRPGQPLQGPEQFRGISAALQPLPRHLLPPQGFDGF
jgi:hypothetical protein